MIKEYRELWCHCCGAIHLRMMTMNIDCFGWHFDPFNCHCGTRIVSARNWGLTKDGIIYIVEES
ncbi:MAG: hypothetical protein ACW963_04900 [Candidatus Sifarchaeia archaeon]|jgi:hypothetical protein